MAAPAWFNKDFYLQQKLNEMQANDATAEWVMDDLIKAMEDNGFPNTDQGIYDHFVQWGNSLDENLSPNPWFDVKYYMNQKLLDMQKTQPDYTASDLQQALTDAGLTAWDHYTRWGFIENINPSADFNTEEYMAAKLAQYNAANNTNIDRAQLNQLFLDADLNPIEHWFDWGHSEGLSYTPGSDTPASDYNDIPLTADQTEYTGTAGNDNFIGDFNGNSTTSSLQRDATIDGAGGDDMLTVNLSGNWQGFSSKGSVDNVETVTINNVGSRAYNFNTQGINGATDYEVNGNIANLTNLGATVETVGMHNVSANSKLGFAGTAFNGLDDTLTLNLENVGVVKGQALNAVNITVPNVENLNVDSVVTNGNGKNAVNFSANNDMKVLNISGDGNLDVTGVDKALQVINAGGTEADSQARAAGDAFTGNLNIDATGATSLKSITLGEGSDTIIINDGVEFRAPIEGNGGSDKLILDAPQKSTYDFKMNGVEAFQIDNAQNNVAINGENVSGLDTLIVNASGATAANPNEYNVVLGDYTGQGDMTAKVQGYLAGNVELVDADTVNFVVGDDKAGTPDVFTGSLIAENATNVAVKVEEGSTTGAAAFNGKILAQEATDLSIATSTNNSTFTLTKGSIVQNVSNVDITGYDKVNILNEAGLGTNSSSLNVDASGLYADLDVSLTGKAGQSLDYTGSTTGANQLILSGAYDTINYTGGQGRDVLNLTGLTAVPTTFNVDLGAGNNTVWVNNSAIKDQLVDAGVFKADEVKVQGQDAPTAAEMNGAIMDVPQYNGTITTNLADQGNVVDYSGITYAEGQKVEYTGLQNGQKLILGDTTGNNGQTGSYAYAANTTVDASKTNQVVLDFAADQDSELGLYTYVPTGVGPASSGTTSLNITNSGGNDVQIIAAQAGLDSEHYNRAFSNVSSVTLDSGSNADAEVQVFGYGVASEAPSIRIPGVTLTNVTDVALSGKGSIAVQAQLGAKTVTQDLRIDATNAGNVTINGEGGMIVSKNLDYNGSNGDDDIYLALTSTKSNIVDVDLGTGADNVLLQMNNIASAATGPYNTDYGIINIDLGIGDNSSDTITIQGTGNASATRGYAGGALVSIEGYANNDTVTWTPSGTYGLVNHNFTTETAAANILKAFGEVQDATAAAAGVTLSTDGSVFGYEGSTYFVVGQGTGTTVTNVANYSTNLKGVYLVELVGVPMSDSMTAEGFNHTAG